MPDIYVYGKWYEKHVSEISGPFDNFRKGGISYFELQRPLVIGFMVLQMTGLIGLSPKTLT